MDDILYYTIGSTILIGALLLIMTGDLFPKRKWGENHGKKR
jgi:hypothetical protein